MVYFGFSKKIIMTYEEAQEKLLNVKWKIVECNTKNCWCRMIFPEEEISYNYTDIKEEVYVVGSGSLTKEIAEYIVYIHNKNIDGKK